MLDEELNYSKKQTRARLNTLIQEADEKMRDSAKYGTSYDSVPVSLDVAEKTKKFSEVDEERHMVVHEQLAGMERYFGTFNLYISAEVEYTGITTRLCSKDLRD